MLYTAAINTSNTIRTQIGAGRNGDGDINKISSAAPHIKQ